MVLACGRTVLGGKARASVYEWCWRVVERSWVVRPVPVCVVLVCGGAVLGGKACASVCGVGVW